MQFPILKRSEAIVQDLAKALSVPVNPSDLSTKRIGRIQEHTGH